MPSVIHFYRRRAVCGCHGTGRDSNKKLQLQREKLWYLKSKKKTLKKREEDAEEAARPKTLREMLEKVKADA